MWTASPRTSSTLDPRANGFLLDAATIANDCVVVLCAEAGRDPYDKRLSDLLGTSPPAARSSASARAHHVKLHRPGMKRFHRPVVGELTPNLETLDLPGDPGQKILVNSAEPGSPSRQALDLLASWASTPPDEPAEQRRG